MAEKPEDLSLPLAVISRLINEAIPPNTNVSNEARKVICRTASVFILYTTATAGQMATKHNRKTMNAMDVIEAIEEMDFPQFVEPLRRSLQQFRDLQQQKKINQANRKTDSDKSTTADGSSASDTLLTASTPGTGQPQKKKSPQQQLPVELVTISDSESDMG